MVSSLAIGLIKMKRRHFLKLLAIATTSTTIGCNKDGSSDNDPIAPPPPPPVYELTDGTTLYDNFDGQGGYQDYDGSELAVAGQLSSNLWRGNFDVVDNPSNIVAVVNENGQSVQYGWEDIQVQQIITYLQENIRPITYFEKEQFEKFLNPKGKDLVVRLEEKDIEKQHKILQYVLTNRKSLFNKKGLVLDGLLNKEKGQNNLTYEALNEIVESGFTEDEIMVLYYLQQEVDLYNGNLKKKLRDAGKKSIERVKHALGIETRIDPVEYKYTFDIKGELNDVTPHIPGQPYHSSRQLRWIDDKGQVHATAQAVPGFYAQSASGNVVKMEGEFQGSSRLELINPEDIEFADYKSYSADLMIPSVAERDSFHIGIDFHTSGIHGPISSLFQIGIRKDSEYVQIFANGGNKNTDYRFWYVIKEVSLDIWHNVQMDIFKNDENKMVIEFFHNSESKITEFPPDGDMYWDPNQTIFGPKRSFELHSKNNNPGKLIAFIDNVNAVYQNRIG